MEPSPLLVERSIMVVASPSIVGVNYADTRRIGEIITEEYGIVGRAQLDRAQESTHCGLL